MSIFCPEAAYRALSAQWRYLVFIGTVGIIFNLFCVLMGMFGKNVLTAVYTAFGVWVFTNLLAKVYFNFGTTPDW